MAPCGFKAKYGEPGNFGTGYWGRKIQDPAERLSAFIVGFLCRKVFALWANDINSHLLHV